MRSVPLKTITAETPRAAHNKGTTHDVYQAVLQVGLKTDVTVVGARTTDVMAGAINSVIATLVRRTTIETTGTIDRESYRDHFESLKSDARQRESSIQVTTSRA